MEELPHLVVGRASDRGTTLTRWGHGKLFCLSRRTDVLSSGLVGNLARYLDRGLHNRGKAQESDRDEQKR